MPTLALSSIIPNTWTVLKILLHFVPNLLIFDCTFYYLYPVSVTKVFLDDLETDLLHFIFPCNEQIVIFVKVITNVWNAYDSPIFRSLTKYILNNFSSFFIWIFTLFVTCVISMMKCACKLGKGLGWLEDCWCASLSCPISFTFMPNSVAWSLGLNGSMYPCYCSGFDYATFHLLFTLAFINCRCWWRFCRCCSLWSKCCRSLINFKRFS